MSKFTVTFHSLRELLVYTFANVKTSLRENDSSRLDKFIKESGFLDKVKQNPNRRQQDTAVYEDDTKDLVREVYSLGNEGTESEREETRRQGRSFTFDNWENFINHKDRHSEENAISSEESEEIHFDFPPKNDNELQHREDTNWIDYLVRNYEHTNSDCGEFLEIPTNSYVTCSKRSCTAICHDGYNFPDGRAELLFSCENKTWVPEVKVELLCEPVCLPPCQNNGKCFSPNQCLCTDNFDGPQCQFHDEPCLGIPPKPRNSQMSCTQSICSFDCLSGFSFLDGSTSLTMKCHQGEWQLEKSDLTFVEDCEAICDLPCLNGGICLGSNKCQCPEGYSGVQCEYGRNEEPWKVSNNSKVARGEVITPTANQPEFQATLGDTSKECSTWSGFHYKNFDGQIFRLSESFDGDCAYVLVQDLVASTFKIVTEKTRCKSSTCTRTLKIHYQFSEYILHYEDGLPVFSVDGQIKRVPIQLDKFLVEQKKNEITVRLETIDLRLTWTKTDHLHIRVNEDIWGKIGGLCGGINNKENEDISHHDLQLFTGHWMVENENTHGCNPTITDKKPCSDQSTLNYCDRIFNDDHFQLCFGDEKLKLYKQACILDVCRCGKDCACETIKEFVESCRRYLTETNINSTIISDWREIAECPLSCPPGKVYSACGPMTEPSCGSFDLAIHSQCIEGCFCPSGKVLLNQTCISRENCPCQWKNEHFENGKKINKECNTWQVLPDFFQVKEAGLKQTVNIKYGNEEVILKNDNEIWLNGKYVSISLPVITNGILGLCGTFNSNQKDDFLTSERDIEQTPFAFADKWKTEETCINKRETIQCDSNMWKKQKAEEYCQHLKEGPFKDCHQYVDVEPFYKDCVQDVCQCSEESKTCACPIFAHYGNECSKQGLDILWRNEITDCGLHCPLEQIYHSCGNSCTRSCRDIALMGENCKPKCSDGCNCPEGLTLNSNGLCIPISKCPCSHNNLNYEAGEVLLMKYPESVQYCTCTNARWACRPATKLEIDRDYENGHQKCNESLNEEFTTCEPSEPKTCKNMHEQPKYTNRICFPGCVCKKGFIWDSVGKKCVNITQCPCHHGEKSYTNGEKIQVDCNTCICENGLWTCTKKDCTSTCSVWGDSHFKTFDGKIYDFQGSCEFILVSGSLSQYDTFVVTLDIVPCGSSGNTCPKMVSLKVGPQEKEENIVFKNYGFSYSHNDMERISVREIGLFIVAEVFDLGITLRWDRNTRIYLKADSRWKNRVTGLCGNYNDNDMDDFKTPISGETSEVSVIPFVDSWRVHTYCPETSTLNDACELQPRRKTWAVEKCSILISDVFAPCHAEIAFQPYLERCIIDSCGCDEGGDCECLCSAIAAYTEECTQRGIPIKWRSQHLCPMQCSAGSDYHSCISTCPPKSCKNRHHQHPILFDACSREPCVEGCQKPICEPGYVLIDDNSISCVPITTCKSACLTVNNVTYLEGDIMESDDCHSCYCSRHRKICLGMPCPKYSSTQVPASTDVNIEVITPSTSLPVCPDGQVWDNCIINCDHLCNNLRSIVGSQKRCSDSDNCLSGCKPTELDCPIGSYLRADFTCVSKKDCPCSSTNGTILKPGDVVEMSECEKCQCINNELQCTFVCHTTIHPSSASFRNFTVETEIDFVEDGKITMIYHTTDTPFVSHECSTGQYESLVDDFSQFSASSNLNEFSSADQARMSVVNGGWEPAMENDDQYLEIDLGRIEVMYGVNVAGVAGKYVTSYYLSYSLNGHKYVNIRDVEGKKEVFGGPFDGQHSVKRIFTRPIEARYLVFYPISWHEGIGLKIDILGCKTTTEATTHFPMMCSQPIGLGKHHFPELHVIVTSSKPGSGPEHIGMNNQGVWEPLTNSKSEWVQLNFGSAGNFTGIMTKGYPERNGVPESWVERYKIMYSGDELTWNPIVDEFGHEMIFMGNTDGKTLKKIFFKRPIHAKALKIEFVKWHENIAFKLDVIGCYNSPAPTTTTFTEKPKTNCSICPGALYDDKGLCKCTEHKWWDGEKCVPFSECPCFFGLIAYPVGTTYTTDKCEECICRLFGIPHCFPKVCPDCPHGLQKVLTPLCGCTCKPCEGTTRLCPKSNVCIDETAWCNGVQDCPDDEVNCTSVQPTEKIPLEPNACEIVCPPGYQIVEHHVTIAGPSESELTPNDHYKRSRTKSKKMVKTYLGMKKTVHSWKRIKFTQCPAYDCVKMEGETHITCSSPSCPPGYTFVIMKSAAEVLCPLWSCVPEKRPDDCYISSQNIKTFDGVEYKYDICDHILARDDFGKWNVQMFKDCNFTSPCTTRLGVQHGNHSIELNVRNHIVKFDSITFAENQVAGKLRGHLNGLCGLYNGNPQDDKTLPQGKLSKTTADFGNSWFNVGAKACLEPVCSLDKQNIALEICSTLRKEPFASCGKETSLELCIESVCNCLSQNISEDECRCQKFSEIAMKCPGTDLFGWRVTFDCPPSCPFNLVHYDCYPYVCEPTCGTEKECAEPAPECFSGCFCPDGMVKKGNTCIKVSDCRDCMCSGMGDSTYLTFDGALTFNGNCTYVATRDKNPSGKPNFEVLVTNDLCNGSSFLTCTKEVTIKVDGHRIQLKATSGAEGVKLRFDGDETSLQNLKALHSFAEVDHNPEASAVTVKLPKYHVGVRFLYKKFGFTIWLPSRIYSGRVEGLCGVCDNNIDLENIEGPDLWQTTPGETCLIEPPAVCTPTPEQEKMCLVMSDVNIFGQCLSFIDPTPFIDQCMEILCLNGHICNSIEAFSRACRDVDVCVNWRSPNFCPFTCPSGEEEIMGVRNSGKYYRLQILVNGTCKSEEFCNFCDTEGGHYESELWQVDKCTNCTCNNRIITCNTVRCSEFEKLDCKEDEILVTEENENECCAQQKCVCKPRHECPVLEMNNSVLPVGMETVIVETGCCSKLKTICQPQNCPEPLPCRTHYQMKIMNATVCCPEYVCEKPSNLCVFAPEEKAHSEGLVREIRDVHPHEIAKEVGERWSDGPCKSCVCVQRDGYAEAICTMTQCPNLDEHQDYPSYGLSEIFTPGKCCPEVVRKYCKHNNQTYMIGDTWLPDESRPCESMRCSSFGDGEILKEIRLQVCNMECDRGWKYERSKGKCCGHCVQVGCLTEDKIYNHGDVWDSNNGCAHHKCVKVDDQFSISTIIESCPVIGDCPESEIYQDKCCLKCKIRSENKKNCIIQSMSSEETIHLVRETKEHHGLCRNLLPLQNFTQCVGFCDSYTQYDPGNARTE
ncbi:hypothetical protein RUM44_009722 [Polyplax serrata]|uniref:Hemocytin n=1 Tax=Polyplax serrata TaxID=468196 RepID=A0ABR1ATI4_POLSC